MWELLTGREPYGKLSSEEIIGTAQLDNPMASRFVCYTNQIEKSHVIECIFGDFIVILFFIPFIWILLS